jgi:quercetin dioxygenase-like cupin family protein
MTEEVLIERGTTLVRRLRLAPGESLPWHVDPFHRVSVVMRGDRLEIEYRDSDEREEIRVHAGQVDWDEPTDRAHRATNVGIPSEEVTIFFLDRQGAPHQPRVEP